MRHIVVRCLPDPECGGFSGVFVAGATQMGPGTQQSPALRKAVVVEMTLESGEMAFVRVVPCCDGVWFLVGPDQPDRYAILVEAQAALDELAYQLTFHDMQHACGKFKFSKGMWRYRLDQQPNDDDKSWQRWLEAVCSDPSAHNLEVELNVTA